ncbi:DUF4011 domain-containing protein [Falsirhodobacter deserti]|uniref:DUF4011 domain-containing protein n=1 Tax=Falsirhodobacter deserti TaxID=1365611 RepID=UPI000FE2B137|nr:DUF4011 domain-containing protein [Falsirhodobacter deserti]
MNKMADVEGNDRVTVDLAAASRVNFASSQNGVSVLQRLVVRNHGEEALEGVTVTVESSPAIFRPRTWMLDRIAPGAEVALPGLETPLDPALLGGLNEAELGSLTLTVRQGEVLLAQDTRNIEMLARDEWGGLTEMAQLLAAHVSPNDAVVAGVLKEASLLLERAGHSGAIDGYQSKRPERAWMLAGAIWSALTGMGLSYAVPPASFEREGQKLRDPARIRAEGLATCLDSALLLAACFEAAGLHPVILFSEGHAWTGVWLVSGDFGAVTEPDVMAVRKAADAREFVMAETTLLTRRPSVGFHDAVAEGRAHVDEDREHDFLLAIDIKRARAARIRPLASHRITDEAAAEVEVSPAILPPPLDFGRLPGEVIEIQPSTAADRIARWQRKLLDLSLRNRLLNFKDTRQTLPFICPDISMLEDRLSGGARFTMLALKDEDPVGPRDLLAAEAKALNLEVARDAFDRGQLAVPLTGKETNARLVELYRRAASDMQEGGTNTLFLAAGFLRWKKTEDDSRSYRAPLLLIPVKLTRRSAQSEYVMEAHEDDVRFNATLLEFLKRDFDLQIPELEAELPRDESGLDLPRIFDALRRRVRDVAGFEVVEELALSTFSFAKFLMWKDLVDRTDSLRESRLVRHLVDNPENPFLPEGAPGLPIPQDVDRRIAPTDLFAPLPADSSQLAAVLAAQEGHDFVLIGPPGTGKSQTIANIIAQCLAFGKTVLFVAEKSAALDVVHRRLSAHGLGDATLELHSSKADRKSVLEQLGRSWDRSVQASDEEWVQVADDLRLHRDRLNAYVEALHRKGSQGFSVFQAIGRVASAPDLGFTLAFGNRDAHDAESYRRLRGLAETAGRTWQIAGTSGFALIATDEWSFSWEAELLDRTATLRDAGRALLEAMTALRAELGLRPDPEGSVTGREGLAQLSGLTDGPDLSWALDRDIHTLRALETDLASLLRQHQSARDGLAADYALDGLPSMPLEKMDTDWRVAQTRIWPLSAFAKSGVTKLLQTYAKGAADPERDLPALIRLRDLRKRIDALGLAGCPAFAGADTDMAAFSAWLDAAGRLHKGLRMLDAHVTDPARWDRARIALARRDQGALQTALVAFGAALPRWQDAARAFEAASGSRTDLPLTELASGLDEIEARRAALSDWTRWCAARHEAEAAGLGPLVAALPSLPCSAEDAFDIAYARWWLPLAMDASDTLRQFAHWAHEDAIERFRALDNRATQLAATQVMRRIQHGLPAKDAVPKKSELGTLRHQMGLKRPSMPIRTLVAEMPTSFTRLAPCVLMSPLSVAQYLPAGQAAFDVVIFDEASQITTWDAIGAIARGRQAIVVGDPKQLPPTNFFGRSDDDEEDLPEIDRDLPSILDEVSAAGIPMRQLDWHYRSRDESLIAFSNWHYYGGRLVTFPSPDTQSKAVQLHHVGGVYGRGQGRTNEAEARAITAMIVTRLTEWLGLPEADRLTLGVITFNAEQQKLILDLLDEERRQNPDLEWFFDDEREEPVIVKNLENIQGDERDVMLFSVTFGPDQAGKLSMAFGALNLDGGEKRLNVAVTRARRELHVFASVHADEIDLTRTRAQGVRDLKAFLDFAGRGAVALPAQDHGSLGPVENAFEAAIKSAIEAHGWELRPQIGVSGFRIDLGVVHPDRAGTYLAGIECDGATYHSSATARDRDKVRQTVLEGLGWSILRIWSTEWFRSPSTVASRINADLLALLQADRAKRAAAAE